MIGNLIVIILIMRKIIGYTLTWILYGLGDLISRPMNRFDCMSWLYPAYNWLMLRSYDVQHWAGNNSPWKKVD